MSHIFDVVLEGTHVHPEDIYRYWSNTDPQEIYRVLSENGYWDKFYEDALQVFSDDRAWFFALQDRNPWFATSEAKALIYGEGLYEEATYIDFTFQVAKAFIPSLVWTDMPEETVPRLNFHGSARLTDAL